MRGQQLINYLFFQDDSDGGGSVGWYSPGDSQGSDGSCHGLPGCHAPQHGQDN